MNRNRTLLLTSFAIAASFSMVQAQPATDVSGAWKLAIGASEACPLTLMADGSVTSTADCARDTRVAQWHAIADKIELKTAAGETVGVLRAHDSNYTGKRFEDGRMLVLSR